VGRFGIEGILVDVRSLDPAAIAFVRRHLAQIDTIEDAVERLQVLGKTWPSLSVDTVGVASAIDSHRTATPRSDSTR